MNKMSLRKNSKSNSDYTFKIMFCLSTVNKLPLNLLFQIMPPMLYRMRTSEERRRSKTSTILIRNKMNKIIFET